LPRKCLVADAAAEGSQIPMHTIDVIVEMLIGEKSFSAVQTRKHFLPLFVFVYLLKVSLELVFGQKEFATSIAQKFSAIVFQFGRFFLQMVKQTMGLSP
jgi:hypothetical protein